MLRLAILILLLGGGNLTTFLSHFGVQKLAAPPAQECIATYNSPHEAPSSVVASPLTRGVIGTLSPHCSAR